MATSEDTTRTSNNSDNSLENLVRQVVSHPRFQDAVNNVNPTSNNENAASTSDEISLNSSQNANSNRHTPCEEFQALFNRGASLQQSPNIPQFQRRTSWTPSPSTRTQSKNQGKRNPFCKANNTKNTTKPKKTTFSRKVVPLRRPSDGLVRGGAKAELQCLGHVLSSFKFDKLWSADEVLEQLEQAFKKPLEGMTTEHVSKNQSK